MLPKDFFNRFYPDAIAAMKATGVLASITLAQAAIESGWGEHAPGNNYFGMKARNNWTGAVQMKHTWECGRTGDPHKDWIGDVEIISKFAPSDPDHPKICEGAWAYLINDKFRAYANAEESFTDHGNFLKDMVRYNICFGGDYKQFAHGLKQGGYSSAPDYDLQLIKMIEDHKLNTCDHV